MPAIPGVSGSSEFVPDFVLVLSVCRAAVFVYVNERQRKHASASPRAVVLSEKFHVEALD